MNKNGYFFIFLINFYNFYNSYLPIFYSAKQKVNFTKSTRIRKKKEITKNMEK